MVCAGCKNLDAKKKSDGKNGGSCLLLQENEKVYQS